MMRIDWKKVKGAWNRWMAVMLLLSAAAGIVLFVLIRAATWKVDHVHHHANFAIYVNGVEDELKGLAFYEEVAACSAGESDNPKVRVHLHDQNAHTVHVHDHAVTWSHLFSNLGYVIDDKVLKTDAGVSVEGADGKKLTYMLNGEKVTAIASRLIGDKDVLLVSYGNETDDQLNTQYASIPRDAEQYDIKGDPASCSGSHKESYSQRLKTIMGL